MKIVEGYFDKTVNIPVKLKAVCTWNFRKSYTVVQKMRLDDGSWVEVPPNAVRILTDDLFTTTIDPGYYRFEIYGVEPE